MGDAPVKRWGVPIETWSAAVDEVVAVLESRAHERATITYGDLAASLRSVRFQARSWGLMTLLGEACDRLDADHGTMVASLVVRTSDGMPGEGYFSWAEREGYDVTDRRGFWEAQLELVFEHWAGSKE